MAKTQGSCLRLSMILLLVLFPSLLMLGAFGLALTLRERRRWKPREWDTYKDWLTYGGGDI
jgi:hypothetical protein